MAPERRTPALLAVLVCVLALVVYVRWPRTPPAPAGGRTSAANAAAAGPAGLRSAPDVRLEALEQAPPSPGDAGRNLFRFRPKPAPPAPTPRPPAVRAPAAPPVQAPPPVPPIPLKFIGILTSGGDAPIAVLSDGRGAPMYGKAGDTVLGQYKILRIGVESIEMSYLDGRGRQTIRLSGS
jgi:hypothetical protein